MAGIFSLLRDWLTISELRGLDVDDPRLTALRKGLILRHAFLRRIYETWYDLLSEALPLGPGPVLELGSGGGFLPERVPGVIASEVFYLPSVKIVLDGRQLPFACACLRAISMVDVLHHIPDAPAFFREAARCVRPGGVMTVIEPWITAWSRFVYVRMHKEPFLLDAPRWEFPSSGPLSGANGALPWIIFERDRATFESEFPEWEVTGIRAMMPFVYLVSGGVSMRPLMPGWTWGMWAAFEKLFPAKKWGMFAQVTLRRKD
jgi:SAM-dependent methyltransferase